MINNTIVDESGTELSIHFNRDGKLVLTLNDHTDAVAGFLVIQLTKDDAKWMSKQIKNRISELG